MPRSPKILICLALAGAVATGCSNPETPARPGTLSLSLTTTQGTTVYRLMGATFALAGTETLSVTPAPEEERFRVDLAAGDYTITLQDGWHMESSTDGAPFAAVNAVLASPASQSFSIFAQEITSVRFTFRAGEEVMEFGDGRLNLEIEVEEVGGAACGVAHSSCSQSTVTCSGHTATIENTCLFSTGPDGTSITCNGDTTTIPSGFGVAENGYGNAARQLADLQRRLLLYFAAHGQFPVETAAYTPLASCCGAGGVFECPGYAGAWEYGVWQTLGFAIAADHSFVFSYNAPNGEAAQVTARGDLDCDGISIDYGLSCSVINGNPSCTLSLPVPCIGGADYE